MANGRILRTYAVIGLVFLSCLVGGYRGEDSDPSLQIIKHEDAEEGYQPQVEGIAREGRFLESLVCFDPKTAHSTVETVSGNPPHMGSQVKVTCDPGMHFVGTTDNSVTVRCDPAPHPCMCIALWERTDTFMIMNDLNCTQVSVLQCRDPSPINGTVKVLHGTPYEDLCNVLLICGPGLVFPDGARVWNLTCVPVPSVPPSLTWIPQYTGTPTCSEHPVKSGRVGPDISVDKIVLFTDSGIPTEGAETEITEPGEDFDETRNAIEANVGTNVDDSDKEQHIKIEQFEELTNTIFQLDDKIESQVLVSAGSKNEVLHPATETNTREGSDSLNEETVEENAETESEPTNGESISGELEPEQTENMEEIDDEDNTEQEPEKEELMEQENDKLIEMEPENEETNEEDQINQGITDKEIEDESEQAEGFENEDTEGEEPDFEDEFEVENTNVLELTSGVFELIDDSEEPENMENSHINKEGDFVEPESNIDTTNGEDIVGGVKTVPTYDDINLNDFENNHLHFPEWAYLPYEEGEEINDETEEEQSFQEEQFTEEEEYEEVEEETEEYIKESEITDGRNEENEEGGTEEEIEHDTEEVEEELEQNEEESELYYEEEQEEEPEFVHDIGIIKTPVRIISEIEESHWNKEEPEVEETFPVEEEEPVTQEDTQEDEDTANYEDTEAPEELKDAQMSPFRSEDEVVTSAEDAVCKLPAKTGFCRMYIRRFFFNTETGECEQFTYGGCDGNGNNFETLQDCLRNCRTATLL